MSSSMKKSRCLLLRVCYCFLSNCGQETRGRVLSIGLTPFLVSINNSYVFVFTRVDSRKRVVGMIKDYFASVKTPCSSTENLMLLSGDVVVRHHC